MSIRDVLVHLADDTHSDGRLGAAAAIAENFDAHLIGLHVTMPQYLPGHVQTYFTSEMLRELGERKDRATADAKSHFDAWIKQAGVRAEWRHAEGDPARTVASHGRYADIIVVSQHDFQVEEGGNIAEEVVISCSGPAIAVPFTGEFKTLGRRVLVAWNGSREAARATHDALPFLAQAEKVLVLSVDTPDEKHIAGTDISTHLARHGVRVEVHNREQGEIGVGDAILNASSDFGADLLVLGAYGHSRVRELVLGGATRHLLRHMTVPVLMSH